MSEHLIQSAYFQAVRMAWPDLKLIYAIPNGGMRNKLVAFKLKREGVTPGIPDVNIDIAAHGFNGARIEFKMPGNKPTDNQKETHRQLTDAGYLVEVHTDPAKAFEWTKWYLGGRAT
jgi:hypothetical protein